MRLAKFLAHAGIASRRHSEDLITQGRVTVNGEIITAQGTKIDPCRDTILVDGNEVAKPEKKIYILLHKPENYVTTVHDPQDRPKVTDLLKTVGQRVYPVGRLDYDSTGLLLLTNDGDLAYRLTHPSFQVPKTYRVIVKGLPDQARLIQLSRGVHLDDGWTSPAKVHLVRQNKQSACLEIIIHEGRKRQVKRMCQYINHPVLSLQRTRLGPLKLGSLKPGQYRHLTAKEINALQKTANLKNANQFRPSKQENKKNKRN